MVGYLNALTQQEGQLFRSAVPNPRAVTSTSLGVIWYQAAHTEYRTLII